MIIFDECHRSQFGEMHKAITKSFKHYHIFGFTGTPIFAVNAQKNKNLFLQTTPQAFGDKLHTYTIVDAINDKNVLPFRIDFVNTVKQKNDVQDRKVRAIDIERAMNSPERITNVVTYILDHFDQQTKRNKSYNFSAIRNVKELASSKDRSKIDELKEKGLWIYGADMDGETYCTSDLKGACALVIGSEGKGLQRLVKEKCDVILSLPMLGKINSLNASVAAGV